MTEDEPQEWQQLLADARLIAAAPDLFKALDELMQAHDEDIGMDGYPDDESIGFQGDGQDMPMTFGMLRRARAAIKKARGEE